MKIAQLCPYAMDRPGGVQRNVRDLAAWLDQQGHETRIIAPPAPGARPKPAGNLIELGQSRAFGTHGTAFELSRASGGAVRQVVQELKDWGAELVHMHTPWTPMLVWQVWRRLRLPTAATIHATLPSPDAKGVIDRYIRWSARRILAKSDAIIVPSTAPLEMLHRLDPGLQAAVLPPAVNLQGWRDLPHVTGEGLRLTFIGRLEDRKGVAVLLKAWPEIAAALPKAHLTIAGDGEMRDQVQAMIGARLTHLGRLQDAEMQSLLSQTDLFLAPAPYGESYGLVLAEAMASGAVPVAAGNAGYTSVIGDSGAALIVPPGDAEALAQKVIELARDPKEIARWRIWASERSRASDVATVGPQYEALFQSVLKRSSPASSR